MASGLLKFHEYVNSTTITANKPAQSPTTKRNVNCGVNQFRFSSFCRNRKKNVTMIFCLLFHGNLDYSMCSRPVLRNHHHFGGNVVRYDVFILFYKYIVCCGEQTEWSLACDIVHVHTHTHAHRHNHIHSMWIV